MLSIHLAIRFFIELAVLIFIGYWGFTIDGNWLMKGVLGIGCPLIVAGIWGLFVAPKAIYSLPSPGKIGIEAIIFLFGVYAVYACYGLMAASLLGVITVSYTHLTLPTMAVV